MHAASHKRSYKQKILTSFSQFCGVQETQLQKHLSQSARWLHNPPFSTWNPNSPTPSTPSNPTFLTWVSPFSAKDSIFRQNQPGNALTPLQFELQTWDSSAKRDREKQKWWVLLTAASSWREPFKVGFLNLMAVIIAMAKWRCKVTWYNYGATLQQI